MFEALFFIPAALFSLIFWGWIRTALWILPALLWADYAKIAPAAILSLFLGYSWLAKYRDGAFESSSFEKAHNIALLFIAGVLGAALLYPVPLLVFGLCSLVPLFFVRLYALLKMPLSRVWFFPLWWRWALTVVWVLVFGASHWFWRLP